MPVSGYTKLFASILESTVWETDLPTKVVWITLLAMADRDGIVEASLPGLARRAGVSRLECESAITAFLSPDRDSRTKEHEGRRIEVIDGGWRLLNHGKYRERSSLEDMRKKTAERVRRHRERRALQDVTNVTVTQSNPIAEAEAEADTKAEAKIKSAPATVQTKPIIDGQNLRRHGQHGWCDFERGLCVTRWVHDELVGKLGGQDREGRIRSWYQTIVEGLDPNIPVGDAVDAFWRNNFAASFGTVTRKPSEPSTTTKGNASVLASERAGRILEQQAADGVPNIFGLKTHPKQLKGAK